MDDLTGNFQMADSDEELKELMEQTPDHGGIFTVGERLVIKGSHFKVCKITPKKLTLRLQPKPIDTKLRPFNPE